MKLNLCLLGLTLGFDEAEIKEKFETAFNKNFNAGIDRYTHKSHGEMKNFHEAVELATSLTLTDDDFKDSFAFCANGDEFISKKELKKCTKKALGSIIELTKDADLDKEAMREMKKRMKFDSDGDKNINFDEWKAAVTTLNDALAVTMVEVFDGITGTKDGKLSGTVEVSAMGSMLAQFYKKVDPRTTRTLLQGVNEDCDPSPCTGEPSPEDRATISSNELRDFLQLIYNHLLNASDLLE